MAYLRAAGMVPKLRQLFMMKTRQGPEVFMASIIILAGTMSRGQVVAFSSWTALLMTQEQTGAKLSKTH